MEGKVVWITGASSGIGEALAYELSARGARLVLSARRQARLEAVRARCVEPDRHEVLAFDVTERAAHEALAARVIKRFGRIDFLINNAGVSQRSLAAETLGEVERRIFELDYFAPVSLTKAVLPTMLRQRSGRLVAVSSLAGLVATPYRSTYAAAKAALIAYHDALRAEQWKSGVEVSVLCPGFVLTEIGDRALVGDGSESGGRHPVRADALTAEVFARRAVARLEAGDPLIVIAGKEKALWWLARLSPALAMQVVRRVKVI